MSSSDTISGRNRSNADAPPEDDLYGALADPRRRCVVTTLSERNEPLSLTELAREVAARESNGETTPDGVLQRIRIDLYHVHAPKLAAADLIEFDHATNTIAPAENDVRVEFAPGRSFPSQ